MTETFSLTDVGYIKRVVVGNDNPETAPDEKKYERQMELLNRCLKESPKGKIVGQEKNFYLFNLGEHQVVMQYIVYHIGFARKPHWIDSVNTNSPVLYKDLENKLQ